MLDRDQQILSAAINVFGRYGVAKTTMGDIAVEAGMSRQTVYNAFASKTEVLRAAVRFGADASLNEIKAAWGKTEALDARIDIFFEHGPISWFDLIQATPELAELFDGVNAIAGEEMKEAHAAWVGYFAAAFEEAPLHLKNPDISHRELAEFMYSTAKNAKHDAADRDALLARLRIIKSAVLALVAEQSG